MALYRVYEDYYSNRSFTGSRLHAYAPELPVNFDRRSSGYMRLPRVRALSDGHRVLHSQNWLPLTKFEQSLCVTPTKYR